MSEVDLRGVVDTLRAALARRSVLADDIDAGRVIEQHVKLAVLDSYGSELGGLNDRQAIVWLVDRIAELEARVLTLQSLLAQGQAPAEPTSLEEDAPWSFASAPKYSSRPPPATNAPAETKPAARGFAAGGPSESQPETCQVEFDPKLVQDGFYEAERSEDWRWFRWLGPEPRASVFLPRIDGPVRVTVKVIQVHVSGALERTRVSIDGGAWVACEISTEPGVHVLTAYPTPGPANDRSTVEVRIDCGATDCPADHGLPETRHLGIAVCSVQLQALVGERASGRSR